MVLLIGIARAWAIAFVGILHIGQLGDDGGALRADAIAATLAARMRKAAPEEQAEIVGRAARRSGTELLVVEQGGQILVDESYGAPSKAEVQRLVQAGNGETRTALGRVRFAARALDPPRQTTFVLSFVSAPSPPAGYVELVNAVSALTLLLLGVAVAVAHAFAKQVRDDVDFVRDRIVDMARPDAAPTGQQIPIR